MKFKNRNHSIRWSDLQSRLLSLGFLIHLKPLILLLSPKKLMLLYLKVRLDYSALFKTILQFS